MLCGYKVYCSFECNTALKHDGTQGQKGVSELSERVMWLMLLQKETRTSVSNL